MNNDAINPMYELEDTILGLLVAHPELLLRVVGIVREDDFTQPDIKALWQSMQHVRRQCPVVGFALLPVVERVSQHVRDLPTSLNLEKTIEEACAELRRLQLERSFKIYREQAREAALNNDKATYRQILQQLSRVQQQMRTLRAARELGKKHEHTQN